MKVILVAGARPNFMKIAPLMTAFGKRPRVTSILVHTGQHYDRAMSELFFQELGIPAPDVNLGVGSSTHAVQTAEIMRAFEPVVTAETPDAVIVVGDVNSTVACGLVAVKLGITLVHVEAGLRSFDRTMPEEINRVVCDAISDILLCSEPSGVENLRREGVPDRKIRFVGNVMIDTLLRNRDLAERSTILDTLDLRGEQPYAVVTLHRPSNVDNPDILESIMTVLDYIGRDIPVVFPVHPRTRLRLNDRGNSASSRSSLKLIEPLGYLDFLKLMAHAQIVMTDSGGIQEETTILGTPCLTLRENTERPVTVEMGTNRVVGSDPARILAACRAVMAKTASLRSGGKGNRCIPPLWDGRAAERIADIVLSHGRKKHYEQEHETGGVT